MSEPTTSIGATYIPPQLIERPDLLAEEAEHVRANRINWRGRLRNLGTYGLTGGSPGDRRAIVQFMAALEAHHIETGRLCPTCRKDPRCHLQ